MRICNQLFRKLLLVSCVVAAVTGGTIATTVAAAEADEFAGKRIVSVLEEPRHRTVHRDGDLYLLDVQINPGDISLPHTHNSALLVIQISNGKWPLYGRLSANTDYVTEPGTHELGNPGPGLMRIIAMTNLGPGETDVTAGRPRGVTGDPEIENPWFRSYRIKLGPGAETPVMLFENPSVVVQVTEGKLHVTRVDGITAELDEMAKWAWRDANMAYQVRNAGFSAVEFIVSEGRR